MTYISRSLEGRLAENLQMLPAVFVGGARQAGKSTLVKHLAQAGTGWGYATFDDIATFASATRDPEQFVERLKKPAIIDEVQLVPGVFRVLKRWIDELRAAGKGEANGLFLLTGSADALVVPELTDALVGRIAVLSLYPLSASEALASGTAVINGWFDQEIEISDLGTDPRQSIGNLLNRATFPEISGATEAATAAWFDGYLTSVLQRDVRQIVEVERTSELPNVLSVLASRTGGLLNDSDCARDAKLSVTTFRRYRALMERLFLVTAIPPWHRNIGKRFVKAPKLYFTDTALLCHQLGVGVQSLRRQNPSLFGRVLENFVATELIKQLSVTPGATLHHFRTHDGQEADFVIERRNSTLLGIEVKAGATVSADDFKGLEKLRAAAGDDFVRGIVLYAGAKTLPFGDRLIAMPIEGLWKFDMAIKTDGELKCVNMSDVFFWANYGRTTRVRCVVPGEVIRDHFADGATGPKAVRSVKRHWEVIWPALQRKIREGRIEIVAHDHEQAIDARRFQKELQVVLDARDFGNIDYRRA